MSEPRKLLMCGDWHGDTTWAIGMIDVADREDCDGIVQVGDLGAFWPGCDSYHRKIQRALGRAGLELWFVDGNHDNHDELDMVPLNPTTGFADITESIHHIPRGHRWTWSGVRFLGLGGAHSIDRNRRRAGHTWWPQETITDDQADRAAQGPPVDIMVCHDAPSGFNPFGDIGEHPQMSLETDINRQHLYRVAKTTRPTIIFCGHWHTRTTARLNLDGWTTQVEVLNRDNQPGAWETLELKEANANSQISR